jgi:hypothetical protein
MFCKPPCPDENDFSPDDSNNRSTPERPLALPGQDAFGRQIAPEAAGPERGLPPAAVRTG